MISTERYMWWTRSHRSSGQYMGLGGLGMANYVPNSYSDSAVPEIFRQKNRQSTSEANPGEVSNDAILPSCSISLFQVKEETNCLLPLCKSIQEILSWLTGLFLVQLFRRFKLHKSTIVKTWTWCKLCFLTAPLHLTKYSHSRSLLCYEHRAYFAGHELFIIRATSCL